MSERIWFGLGLPSAVGDVATLLAQAGQADREGLDLVTVSDHPYVPDRLEAYATTGVLLGRTSRITAGVNVSNLPLRPAPMLARTVAGLSALSGGRVVLGIGAGGTMAEIVRLGVPRLTPGGAVRAMAEGIEVVRLLCGGGAGAHREVSYDGEFHSFAGLVPSPVAAPPVWTGSNGPASLAVTGRLADGWIPGHAADWLSERYAWSRPLVDEAATAAGRDPREVATIYNLPGRITAEPLRTTRSPAGRWIGGSPSQWVEELTGAVLDHGASGFILFPTPDGTPIGTTITRWATEVAPAVRAATKRA